MIASTILPFSSPYANGGAFIRCAVRRGHKFRSDGIVNRFAQNRLNGREIALVQTPAADLADGYELFWTTCAPQRDANTRLVKKPTGCQMDHALAEMFLGECVQPVCRVQIFGEVGRMMITVKRFMDGT